MGKTGTLILMIIAVFLGNLPWYNFSAVMPYIAKDFGLTSADAGLIISVFQLGYVIVVVITGWLADKIGAKKVAAWAVLMCAITATLFPFVAKDFTTILVMRLLTGLSAGAIYAPSMVILSNWFAPAERGKAIGALTAGMVAAYAGAYFVASPLAALYNWKIGMLATSAPVFIGAIVLFKFIRNKPEEAASFDGARGLMGDGACGPQMAPEGGYKGPVLITCSYMGHMWELYAFWGWVGTFMMANCFGMGYTEAAACAKGGLLAAIIILLAVPAVYLTGIAADKWGRTKMIILTATCSLVPEFFFGYMYGKPIWMVVVVGVWIGLWVDADSAIYKAGLTDMISEKIRGTILGIQSAVGYSMTILSPLVFGAVLQKFNGTGPSIEATVWGPCFLLLGVGALIAPIMAFVTRKVAQAKLMAGGRM